MTMLLPKDIAYKLGISERTVYNYRQKLGSKLKEEKKHGKTYFDFETIAEHIQQFGSAANHYISEGVKSPNESHSESSERFAKLESEKEALEKRSRNIEEQAQKYALALKDEKEEKKALQNRYEQLEEKWINSVERISLIRQKYTIRVALLGGLTIGATAIIIFLLIQNTPS